MILDSQSVLEKIQDRLLNCSQIHGWPEMVELINRPVTTAATPCWEYPLIAAEAVGGRMDEAIPAATTIFSLLQSIHLVDDIIDHDPRGLFRQLGEGNVANIALAFQAIAATVLVDLPLPAKVIAEAQACVAEVALNTAAGQRLDALEITDEATYWRAALAKTPPLFGGALKLGALLAGAESKICSQLEDLGQPIGKIVQLSDDLRDAMESPANADWQGRGNNLAILYATTADYPERQLFEDLLPRVGAEPEALTEAQGILVRSGAVSYCAFHMIETYRVGNNLVAATGLANSKSITDLLDHLTLPLKSLLEAVGVDTAAELFEP